MFQWACLFFGFDEWTCELIFQTLSNIMYIFILGKKGAVMEYNLVVEYNYDSINGQCFPAMVLAPT